MAKGIFGRSPRAHLHVARLVGDQAQPLAPWAQAVSAHPNNQPDNAELRHLTEPSGGTDDAEGPINHNPAWRLVRKGT